MSALWFSTMHLTDVVPLGESRFNPPAPETVVGIFMQGVRGDDLSLIEVRANGLQVLVIPDTYDMESGERINPARLMAMVIALHRGPGEPVHINFKALNVRFLARSQVSVILRYTKEMKARSAQALILHVGAPAL